MKKMTKIDLIYIINYLILAIIMLVIAISTSSCGKRTYVSQGQYIEYMHQDTTKHKFTNAEKTGAVLFGVFVIYAIGEQ